MKKMFLALCLSIAVGNAVQAQTAGLKIAYINSAVLLAAIPERAKADTQIEKYARSFKDQLDMMAKDYQAKVQNAQANKGKWNDAVAEVKMKEISDLEERITSVQQSAEEKVKARRADLYQPIVEKADKALKEVAKEKDLDFIFDQAAGNVMVFGKDQHDITKLVIAKLGLK